MTFSDGLAAIDKRMAALEDSQITDHRGTGYETNRAGERDNAAEFRSFIRTGAIPAEQRDMSVGTDAAGGYAVETHVHKMIRDQLLDISPMRRVCRVESAKTGDFKINVGVRGLASGWVGELATRPVTASPVLAQVSPPMGEIYANTKISQHLIDDANFDVVDYVIRHMADEFALQEGGAFIFGDSVDKPQGFLTATLSTNDDASRTFGQLQYRATGVDGGFAATDPQDQLIDLMTDLRPSYRQGPGVAWVMNALTASVVRKMKDSEGRFIWADSLQAGQPARLLGYPVVLAEDMPDIGSDSLSVAFGNWQRGYSIVDRLDTRVLRDPYTDKPNVLIYGTKRVGGSITDSDAIKILKFGLA